MKNLGILLVVLGLLGLIYGGISYNKARTVLDVGAFKATTIEKKNIPFSPIVGGLVLLSGVLLLALPKNGVLRA